MLVAAEDLLKAVKGGNVSYMELQHLVEGAKVSYAASIQLAVCLTNDLQGTGL